MKLAEKPVARFGTRSAEFRTFCYRVSERFGAWPCKNLSISSAFSLYYFWSFFLAFIKDIFFLKTSTRITISATIACFLILNR
jgi:hypothetical protein